MIAKAKSIAHTRQAITYGLNKEGAEEVCRENLAGENSQEIADEFSLIQRQNNRCVNNCLRFEISPTISDGRSLTSGDWEGIARDFMAKMELSTNRQWVAILHTDREHKHLHIYANRIDYDGKAYNDKFISNRAAATAQEIAQERGLTTAMEVKLHRDRRLEPIKSRIKEAHHKVQRVGVTPQQYRAAMAKQGVEVIFNQASTGRISGMSYKVGDVQVKASEVDRRMSYNKLFNQPRTSRRYIKPKARQILKKRTLNIADEFMGPTARLAAVALGLAPMMSLSSLIKTMGRAMSTGSYQSARNLSPNQEREQEKESEKEEEIEL